MDLPVYSYFSVEAYPAQSLSQANVPAVFMLRRVCYSDSCIMFSRVQVGEVGKQLLAESTPLAGNTTTQVCVSALCT